MSGTRPNEEPADLELREGIPTLSVVAAISFDEVIERVAGALRRLAAERQPHLIVHARDPRFPVPSLAQRAHMARTWADAAAGRVRVAVVAPRAFIDEQRFGVVAARNFGLSAQVFEHEREAVEWLHAERAAELRRDGSPQDL